VDAPLSPHQIGLGDVLALAEALEVAPAELIIIGIQPSRIEAGMGLSPDVESEIPKVVEIILDELKAANLVTVLA
jgi:hydrogenase maturation protease